MNSGLIERLLRRTKELGISPRAASLASGMGATAIRDIIRRPTFSPTMATVQKLAKGLQTTPEWLAYGSDDAPEPRVDSVAEPFGLASDLVQAEYGGTVQAGTFREVDEFADPDRGSDIVHRDERYPRAAYFIFDVAGDSMNAADPPIRSGCQVVAVRLPPDGMALQTGDLVVVQRTKDQGGLIERSVKELELDEHETRFCPRSTNRRHKPIVVPKNFDPVEDSKVEVIGLVVSVSMKVQRK